MRIQNDPTRIVEYLSRVLKIDIETVNAFGRDGILYDKHGKFKIHYTDTEGVIRIERLEEKDLHKS